ncbi:hypothetical protein, partial [Burkholderia ubonensis]|uniref:hypothetical protein n=1 Tax=Burkholderia ubonensis TaxID=101571 RepID=UPI001E5D6EF2
MLVSSASQYATRGGESWLWGEPLFPAGLAIRERGDVWTRYAACWLVQEDDLINVNASPITRRTAGCCGMTGDHGPNLVCRCGIHVASAETDCCLPNFVALDRDAVRPITM